MGELMQKVEEKHGHEMTRILCGYTVINGMVKLWYMDELGLTNPKDIMSSSQQELFMEEFYELESRLCEKNLDQIQAELDANLRESLDLMVKDLEKKPKKQSLFSREKIIRILHNNRK